VGAGYGRRDTPRYPPVSYLADGGVRLAVLLVGSAASPGTPAILWLELVHDQANTIDQAKIFFRRSLLVTGDAPSRWLG
jgi:hypothetical protein